MSTVLHTLVEEEGVQGVNVIRRDGECVLEHFNPALDIPTYSRMSAALTATSESVLPELRGTRSDHIVVDEGSQKIIVVKASDDLLLAALAPSEHSSDHLLRVLQEAARGMRVTHGG